MEELTNLMPGLDIIAFIVIISGAVSFGITQIYKLALEQYLKTKQKKNLWWQSPSYRLLSCLSGSITGFLIAGNITGLLLGFASGAMNTFLVMMMKKYLKKKISE